MRRQKYHVFIGSLRTASLTLLIGCMTLTQPLCSWASPCTLDRSEIRRAAEAAALAFETKYIIAADGKKIADLIRKNLKAGIYDAISQGRELAQRLQTDARSINGDRHITISFAPERIRDQKNPERQKRAAEEARLRARMSNYGFEEIRILAGNIGYIKLNSFMGSTDAFDTAAAAMQFLAGCEAVVIDLRWNPGGESSMVQFLCSYFFDEAPQLLDEFHFRENDRIEQLWTLPHVPGRRLKNTALYILTSGLTFSAAEGMAYDLQALKRAVIVGETTMGGAHPVAVVSIDDNFLINLPYAYSKNPITKSNFEGAGVKPDVAVERENALAAAHLLALETLLAQEGNDAIKPALQWALEGISRHTVTLSEQTKTSYTGTYGPNQILIEKGSLYYRFGPGKLRMLPITEDYFALENFDIMRVKVIKEFGIATGIEVHTASGAVQKFIRVNQ